MIKSPKEIAKGDDLNEQKEFLLHASPRAIQEFLHNIPLVPNSAPERLARAALDIRIAEDSEISTRRIVRLTLALVVLTFALLVLTIALYKDAHAQIERDQLKQYHELKNP